MSSAPIVWQGMRGGGGSWSCNVPCSSRQMLRCPSNQASQLTGPAQHARQHGHGAAAATAHASTWGCQTALASANVSSVRLLLARAACDSMVCAAASGSTNTNALGGFLNMLGQMLQQGQSDEAVPTGAALAVAGLSYQPPGTVAPLLQDVSMQLPANSMGLVYGRSGAGKTTLLKIIGGLAQYDCGLVRIGLGALDVAGAAVKWNGSSRGSGSDSGSSANGSHGSGPISGIHTDGGDGAKAAAARTMQTGLVFQFPERHFLGGTIGQELTFGWPQRPDDMFTRQQLTLRLGKVLQAVGLDKIDLQAAPTSLSDGYKRRLALAVQLARGPSVLLLDEPLAGLDWRARADIAELLGKLKQECTIVVVSHDLHELSNQVDAAWEMLPGGRLDPRPDWRASLWRCSAGITAVKSSSQE